MKLTYENYRPQHWVELSPLQEIYAYKPYRDYPNWSPTACDRVFRARLEAVLSRVGTHAWIIREGERLRGMVCLIDLPWDSQQLGMPAARLDYLLVDGEKGNKQQHHLRLIERALDACQEIGIQHLSVRLDSADLPAIHAVQEAGFTLVDGIITYLHQLAGESQQPECDHFKLRIANETDSESTARLAEVAFIYDRFHSDPAIPHEVADALHAEWLRNSCRGLAADAVLLAEDGDDLLGFVTCKLQADTFGGQAPPIGTIVLVATAPQSRRRGVARALTLYSLEWFQPRGVSLVEVGTQIRNLPAARLYQSCAFLPAATSLTLRRLICHK